MKIFIAGATGALGRRIVPLLLEQGHEVTAIARTAEKSAALERIGASASRIDLFDAEAVRAAVAGHDSIINVATSIPSGSRVMLPWAWKENHRIRREASALLVDAALAAGANRYIQESFAPIYADGGDAWREEDAPLKPASHTRSVLDAEAAARRFSDRGGAGVALRFALFYGEDSGFTRDMIRSVREKGLAPTFGPPDGFISSISHDSAATAVIAALDLPAGVYNVADDEPLRRREYFDALAAILGVDSPKLPPAWLARVAGSAGEVLSRSLRISNRKLRRHSDWMPQYPNAREGLAAVVEALDAGI